MMHNKQEYCDSCVKTSKSLYQFEWDEPDNN